MMATLWILIIAVFGLSLDNNQVKGDCDEILDIAILADVSKSMTRAQRVQLTSLVRALVEKLGVSSEGNHYAVVTFCNEAQVFNTFKDSTYHNKDNLETLIENKFSYRPKPWGTRTDLALHLAVTELFTPEGGDRSNAKNVLLVFTDGMPFISKWDKKPFVPFSQSTKALEDKDVSITIVGVGPLVYTQDANMRKFAGTEGKVFTYADFSVLSNHFNVIMERACASEWSSSECSVTCGGGVKTLTKVCPVAHARSAQSCIPDQKTVSCNEQKCGECAQIMDIALLVDTSRSMTKPQRAIMTTLTSSLVDKLGVSSEGNHFAVITFAKTAEILNTFKDSTYHNKNNLASLMQDKFKWAGLVPWGTRTDLALQRAATELFTSEGGDRPNAKNVLFVFTDGLPFISKWDKVPFVPFSQSTRVLQDKDVSIDVIGVGPAVYKFEPQLEEIAGSTGKAYAYADFSVLTDRFDEIMKLACPSIDGGYTDWFESSDCSVSCGGGTKAYTRTCTNPPPSNGGKDCSELGLTQKAVSCNEQKCPIDGGYTDWSASKCSVTCGGGTQTLTRTCTNPPPSDGGKDCSGLGPAQKTKKCNTKKCPIDGGYTDWSASKCSVTCGGGTQTLTRTCTNPPPSNGGKDCKGPSKKKVSCNKDECPTPAKPCKPPLDIAIVADISRSMNAEQREKLISFVDNVVDKLGVSSKGNHFSLTTFGSGATLHNTFKDPEYYSAAKFKDQVDEQIRVVPTGWGTRTDLALDVTANQLFTSEGGDRPDAMNVMLLLTDGKPFIAGDDKTPLVPFDESTKALENKDVSITVIGVGNNVEKNKADMDKVAGEEGKVFLIPDFDELNEQIGAMLAAACGGSSASSPVDGGWSKWSKWRKCSKTCGGGKKTRSRTCDKPAPANGGKKCKGKSKGKKKCAKKRCP